MHIFYIYKINMSFNRYMVECECYRSKTRVFKRKSFNRYMVECEFYISGFEFRCTYVLIDTWWNVNMFDLHTELIAAVF